MKDGKEDCEGTKEERRRRKKKTKGCREIFVKKETEDRILN